MREPISMIDTDLVLEAGEAPIKKSDLMRFAARKFLNKPGFHTTGHVVAEVLSPKPPPPGQLNSSSYYPGSDSNPRVRLLLADCSQKVSYDFPMHDEESVDNSVYKARTMADVLAKFAEALEEEAREQKLRFKERDKARKAATTAQASSPEVVSPVSRLMRD